MEEIEVQPGSLADEIEVESTRATPVTFSELYEHDFLPLVRLATLMTSRVEVARDIVQDAFVKLHVKWATVRNPAAYVRRSVVNGCRSYHRREMRWRGRKQSDEPTATLDVDDTLSTLSALTPKQRAIIVLKFYEGCNEHEIAEIVGCRPGSVGPTVQRALTRLREVQT
ncbi:MAG: sigma-70 family RNA polymerase sigma factor [Ilumatobacter sp.]|uniref:RNA polymerase sigma factor n=1 Tax=Ilumatobacter sp. TaxID=1967498 RepID=UPI00262D73F9|nr:sigma-70 family RNA polymerase sigma factor [Ilumatobacter sp.]MDJ0767753.1 sigma-70 family RNA polymerase sigma factor [Ilumatobacter sp.]